MSGDLTPDAVLSRLTTRWLGRDLHVAEQVDSTNSRVAQRAREGAAHGMVVVAEQQVAGRGRLQREWHSPAGANLYFSVLLRPAWSPQTAPPLSLAAGVALAESVRAYLPRPPELKWPNDLLFEGRKLAGILVEAVMTRQVIDFVVLGIGLNVNQLQFPPPLDKTAGSLRWAAGRPLDRAELLSAVLARLEVWIDELQSRGGAAAIEAWQQHAAWLGTPIRVSTGGRELRGIALGVDANGALRLRDASGEEHAVVSGDTLRAAD